MIGLGLNYVSSGTPTAGIYGSWQGENYNRTITSVNGSSLNLNTGLKELFTENSYESAAITYQITSTGTWTYLTLVDSEGTVTTYGGQDSGLKASGFGALTSFTYGTDYVKYLAWIIPRCRLVLPRKPILMPLRRLPFPNRPRHPSA